MKKIIILFICVLMLALASCTLKDNPEKDNQPEPDDSLTKITEVRFDFDTKKYELTYSSDIYKAEYIKDPNYNFINVKVTANEEYNFSTDVKLYVNGNLSTQFSLSSDLKELNYKANDPNWTPFY